MKTFDRSLSSSHSLQTTLRMPGLDWILNKVILLATALLLGSFYVHWSTDEAILWVKTSEGGVAPEAVQGALRTFPALHSRSPRPLLKAAPLSRSSCTLYRCPSSPLPSGSPSLSHTGYYSHIYNAPSFYVTTLTSVAGLAIGAAVLKIILNPVDGLLFDGATLCTFSFLLEHRLYILISLLPTSSAPLIGGNRLLRQHTLRPPLPPPLPPLRRSHREDAHRSRRCAG
jgi:hypothetical protein